jgi:MFS transporter, ACS family, tartrate transporter
MIDSEGDTISKIRRRVVPLLMFSYFAAYLDRVNISFAALSMNSELGLSSAVFGAGAGIFFLGYVLFEVPSNLAMRRFGARSWFARIMLSWGVLSLLFAFVRSVPEFLTLRFFLGVAEAGFYPGVMLFLTRWFPRAYLGRMIGAFAVALPASAAIGAPLSGLLLTLDGVAGLRGWQWLFIVEAVPSILLGLVLLKYLPNGPSDAGWLERGEKRWLADTLDKENGNSHTRPESSALSKAIRNPYVWVLGFVYCGIVAANYGVSFFLPQIVRAFGLEVQWIGVVSALPYVAGSIGVLWWGARSDKRNERRRHLLFPGFVAVIALCVVAFVDIPSIKLFALVVAGFGAFANLPVFWTFPPSLLSEEERPAGIAIVSSIGNIAGFGAPYAVGALKDLTGSFSSGMLALAAFIAVTLCVAATIRRSTNASPNLVGRTTT